MRSSLVCAVAAAVAVTSAPASAAPPPAANPVVTWDLHAQTAIFDVAGQQPWVRARSFAMVNGAVFDAVNAVAGTPYQPYLGAPPASGRESVDAAVAAAAFGVLVRLFPEQEQRLRAEYDRSLAAVPDGAAERGGVRVGTRAAERMVAARRDDGLGGDQQWVVGTGPGQWRPTPPAFVSAGAPAAFLRPFLVPWAAHPVTPGPPALAGTRYARDLAEVRRVGALDSTVRTADQTEAAIWWHDRRLVEWQVKRQLAEAHSCGTAARMTAFTAFFGRDAMTFSAYSPDAGATRTFTSFSQAVRELVQARVWGGIHFRAASEDGAALGTAVARYGAAHFARDRSVTHVARTT